MEFGGEAVLVATVVRDAPDAATANLVVRTRLRMGHPRQDNILSKKRRDTMNMKASLITKVVPHGAV